MNRGKLENKYIVCSPEDADASKYLSDMSILDQEHFEAVFLNTKNIVIVRKIIFRGSLSASIVHPREIFREALKRSAASIIVSHPQPSGDPTPSREDIESNLRLCPGVGFIPVFTKVLC